MNKFGGEWTKNKIEILVEYAQAYLEIMKVYASKYNWKLLYFDGFAGSGLIHVKKNDNIIVGAAKRIIEIEQPISFDMYYFVEKDLNSANLLTQQTKDAYPKKEIHIYAGDGNDKIEALGNFLKSGKGKKYKTLAYIDPCGMELRWSALEALERLSVDVWILIPSGMGVNRLLKTNGDISDAWMQKLEAFLGMSKEDIKRFFYEEKRQTTLFGEERKINKKEAAIEKSSKLYSKKLKKLFKFVSEPYVIKNSSNSIMYHFLMATNNEKAAKIADDIVKKYNKKHDKIKNRVDRNDLESDNRLF